MQPKMGKLVCLCESTMHARLKLYVLVLMDVVAPCVVRDYPKVHVCALLDILLMLYVNELQLPEFLAVTLLVVLRR